MNGDSWNSSIVNCERKRGTSVKLGHGLTERKAGKICTDHELSLGVVLLELCF